MSPSDRPTVAIDVDGVLTEHNWTNLKRLNEHFGTSYRYEDITSFAYDFLTEEERAFIYEECWHDPTLYDDATLTPCQERALEELEEWTNIIVVSSPLQGHIESKYRFLKRHFDRSQIILASNKSLIRADLLLDDGPHNLEAFPSISIAFDRPWNRDWDGPRVHDWQFVVNAILHHLKGEDK